MLRYKVKLSDESIRREVIDWREKYLSPNLSFVSGVTKPSYHLEKSEKLSSSNGINNTASILNVECENKSREGYIIVKDKEYDTYPSSTIDYVIDKAIDYRYVENKGKYFYWHKFHGEDKSGYTFNNLLNYADGSVVEDFEIECGKDETPLKIDTVYWIEDGKVEIDGATYIYDRNEGSNGILKYGEDGNALSPTDITRCSDIEFHPYPSPSMYEEVTKFKLTKQENQEESFNKITFAKYYYYVKYKNHYCKVKQKFEDSSFQFICEIPLYVISGKTEDRFDNLETKEYPLYFMKDGDPNGDSVHYEENHNDSHLINSANLDEHAIYGLNDLKGTTSFIYIDEEKAFFTVEHDVLNANDGNEIIVYLDNIYSSLNVGENLLFVNSSQDVYQSLVYNSLNYNGNDEEFVVVDSKKYLIEKNLSDKAIIGGEEYDIEYSSIGKIIDEDCFITIGNEQVPMKIKSLDDGDYSGGTIQRYGKIISGSTTAATEAIYSIKPYSGVTIGDEKLLVHEDTEKTFKYIMIQRPKQHTFDIVEKLGNSTYICKPSINLTEYTNEFNAMITSAICGEVVGEQNKFSLYSKNKIFGDKEITKDLGFIKNSTPTSSDDYYAVLDDLTIYSNNGFMTIPLSLNASLGNDTIQEEIVTRDFYEAEKEKAINPIVDMEKDVYAPKFIYGYYTDLVNKISHKYGKTEDKMYRGSSTIFKPIHQINLNFHFRTRDLISWKINDGNSSYETSGTSDNWFITDFHPYCDILNDDAMRQISGDTLMQASDLMGLLHFTNDDIFYQKSNVAKSFARLSFYDSTDPQTQSLLATSCVFIDEHKLFKRYIDNSRKNEMEYASTSQPIFKKNDGYIVGSKQDIASDENIYKYSKISGNTEYLGLKTAKVKYERYESDYKNVNVGAEEHRLSSRLVIDNKYTTDTSSEGFYIYMFREYAENLHPKPIYMKIEFNHAGIGKTIPFLIPMKWEEKKDTKSNKMIPISAYTFSNMKEKKDLDEFKRGYPLSYIYAQTYIPLYAVYDFEKKEYGYVFDSRYVNQDEISDEGILNLNLFEMKIMDESQEKPTQSELDSIKGNRQVKAVINVNTKQFDKKSFNTIIE